MRFGLLGQLTVTAEDGRLVQVDGARLRVLLAGLLVQAGTPVAADVLAEEVWDGAPPPAAARTLRSHVARLRRVLGPEAGRLVTAGPGYQILVEPAELDLLEFGRLSQAAGAALHQEAWQLAADAAVAALRLWRGQPLHDVPSQILRDSVIPRLERQRVQVMEDQAEAELRLGRHERLLTGLHEMVAAYPLHERFRVQLMLGLYRSGRQAEALAVYQNARTVLAEELGTEPGPELRRLHQRMLAGDEELAVPRSVSGTGPMAPPAVALRQLPAAARNFTGRQPELDLIVGQTELTPAEAPGGTVVISAIDGMAGIGKTALAVHAAHRLAAKFPDGQLFIDLHGFTQGQRPRTADQALTWLLHALGVAPEQVPEDTEQAAALYRQRLYGTRTLVVLDNAATEAQVRPLLPGTGSCLVLITSRRRLKGLDDAHTLSLDVLSAPDAVTLLRAAAGHGQADSRVLGEIAEMCGYLPLALRIAAALLRHRPSWSLEHLAGLLRGQHQRVQALSDGDRDLPAVFDLSYASISHEHQRLWRRLGLIPGPDFDALAAAALAGLDPVAAATLLQDLVDQHLLTEHAPGRFRLHDLLRAHARALAATDPAPEGADALDRLLHYYAHTAQAASVSIAPYRRAGPGGPPPAHSPALADPDTARDWLRAEQPNVDAAFFHAHTHGLDEHALGLAAGIAETLLTDGPFSRAREIYQAAAETAERRGQPAARADALTDLARVQHAAGDYGGAQQSLTVALGIYRALGDRHGEATALTGLGRVGYMTSQYSKAVDVLTQALEICRALGDSPGEATALTYLGRAHCLTCHFTEAMATLTRSLEICRALGDRHGEAAALTELGHVGSLTGHYSSAINDLSEAQGIYRTLGDRHSEGTPLTYLGNVRCLTGDYAGAADALTRAAGMYRAIGNRTGEAAALCFLGRMHRLTGDYPGALDALTRAVGIFRTVGDSNGEAFALNHYAAALTANGQHLDALALYERALLMNRELDKPDDEAISLEGIAEYHLAAGDTARGTAHLHEALEIYRRHGMTDDTRRVQDRLKTLGLNGQGHDPRLGRAQAG